MVTSLLIVFSFDFNNTLLLLGSSEFFKWLSIFYI